MKNKECKLRKKLHDNLPVQDLPDVLEEFYRYKPNVHKNMNIDELACAVSRLVTIMEQFFRCVMREAFNHNKIPIPCDKRYVDKIIRRKTTELLLPTSTATENYLASALYMFQQIDKITKSMNDINIKCFNSQNKEYIKELFDFRHNIIHTVVAYVPPYEKIQNYYDIVEEIFQIVLDGMNIPKLSFYRMKGTVLDSLDYLTHSTECHTNALNYLENINTVEAYVEQSQTYLDLVDIQNTKKFACMAVNTNKNNADANYCKGMVLQIEEDLEGADQFFQKTIQLDKYHIDAYVEHVEYLIKTKDVEGCKKVLNTAIKEMPSIPYFHFKLGSILGKTKDAEKRLKEGDKLIIKFIKKHGNNSLKCDLMTDMLVEYGRKEARHKCDSVV